MIDPKTWTLSMRTTAAALLLLFAGWITLHLLPWWGSLIPALIVGLWLLDRHWQAFLVGFSATGAAWLSQALYIHIANEGLLTSRIADLLLIGSPWAILFTTFLIGALLGGIGTWTGAALGAVWRQSGQVSSIKT